jgi:hypothetical protein
MAESFSRRLQGSDRDAVTGFLEGLHSTNIFLSTEIVETLTSYGVLTPVVSQEAAHEEVAAILAGPETDETRKQACGLASLIFEDVYQGVYYQAIEELEPADRARFLTMAALGEPSNSSASDWTLAELRRYDDPVVIPALQRFASAIDPSAIMPQEAVSCYIHGVAGCAQFLDSPPELNSPTTDDGKAWNAYGAILFWLHKPALSDDVRRAACSPLWRRLETELAFEAVDPLFQLERAGWLSSRRPNGPLEIVTRVFHEEVRRILEFGVQHHTRLSSIFPNPWYPGDRLKFLIQRLGYLGNAQTARLLEPWAEDEKFGGDVVVAIRKLRGT